MLIRALCDYAEKQVQSEIPDGWQEQNIHYRILLTPEGEIKDIVNGQIELAGQSAVSAPTVETVPPVTAANDDVFVRQHVCRRDCRRALSDLPKRARKAA